MNKKFNRILKQVKKARSSISKLTDRELKAKTVEFKRRISAGESTNKLLPEAFAVVCEADKRILGMDPFDCQILGAIAMHYCHLAEMNTGEGKTLTATMPLYLNALTGKSTILVTANEYLAIRDAKDMKPVYEFLGLNVCPGVTDGSGEPFTNEEKQEIYKADIVYTTHGALGFDYLLNNLVTSAEDRFLREFYYIIIDEADSVLLDAAQMPLVISGAPRVQSNLYEMADFFVTTLEKDRDYINEEKSVWLTDEGVAYAEKYFGIEHFYGRENFEINRHVTLALRSHVLFEKEKDYMISERGEITLLDNGTGRSLPGMKLRGGQHQALESKEKIEITQENRSVASITYQNLFLLFPRLSGMSGTLADAKKELKSVYKKKVAVIPPNKALVRIDKEDRFFKNSEIQYEEAIKEALKQHSTGRPVLIVTSTILDTELVSRILISHKVPHSVLNANNAFWEADIIKEAGQKNAVTVSTGMAGRGTDIKLGEGVAELGGLAVIGIGRMANTRLERQAKGRAGRQGDPGSSQFYVCLEDEIVSSVGDKILDKYVEKDKKISSRKLKKLINGAQKLHEELAVEQRKSSIDYDKVVKRQRNLIYDVRNRLLDGESLNPDLIEKLACSNVDYFIDESGKLKSGDIIRYALDHISYNLDEELLNMGRLTKRSVKKSLRKYISIVWETKKSSFESDEELHEYIRLCALNALDNAWVEQVDYLQQLQFIVGGRSSAQLNPVFEYNREAYNAFKSMEKTIKKNITRNFFLGEKEYTSKGEMYVIFP